MGVAEASAARFTAVARSQTRSWLSPVRASHASLRTPLSVGGSGGWLRLHSTAAGGDRNQQRRRDMPS